MLSAAHGTSIDYVEKTILQARTLLAERTKEIQERLKRWRAIESCCGFNIIHNPGFAHLEKSLYGSINSTNSVMTTTSGSSMAKSPSFIFPRNTSEATLVEDGMDTASIASGYSTMTAQAMWPNNSVPMQMRKASSSIYTAYPSPLSSTISPSSDQSLLDDDAGLSMVARPDELSQFANNNGKSIYTRRMYVSHICLI